jgi:hypothetical protein
LESWTLSVTLLEKPLGGSPKRRDPPNINNPSPRKARQACSATRFRKASDASRFVS